MSGIRILLADNNIGFLDACARFIKLAGYEVETAYSAPEARRALEEGWFHLAVLDIRLTDNEDEDDWSGLALARESSPSIPKIMLTAYQTWQAVRESLGMVDTEVPPAVDFVAKQEGLPSLLEHIERALSKYVRLNQELGINWRTLDSFSLVKLIDPTLGGERLLQRSEELQDLFRFYFHEKNQIVVDRQLWQRGGRVALVVFAFAEDSVPTSQIIVCGRHDAIAAEAKMYKDFSPHALEYNGTVLDKICVTTHFGLNSYSLGGADLERVVPLNELFRTAPDRQLGAALTGLFHRTLAEWHQEKRLTAEGLSPEEAYRARLGLTDDKRLMASLNAQIDLIVRKIPTLGVAEVTRTGGNLIIRFGGQVFTYPDPILALQYKFGGDMTVMMKTPGLLTGENVLADASGRTWLTDFSEAGMAPVLWNYIALESAIRFDWAEASDLQGLHDMEQYLARSEFSKFYAGEIEAPLRKVARTIYQIRKLAARAIGKNHSTYNAGILFQSLKRLADFNPKTPLTANDLTRLAHLLIASAVVFHQLVNERENAALIKMRSTGMEIDAGKHEVKINNVVVPLRGQSYELLLELYAHRNELCTRRMLIEQVFKERYDERDESQVSRLNTAISRLRQKIEDNPDSPLLLLTEVQGGYRLVV